MQDSTRATEVGDDNPKQAPPQHEFFICKCANIQKVPFARWLRNMHKHPVFPVQDRSTTGIAKPVKQAGSATQFHIAHHSTNDGTDQRLNRQMWPVFERQNKTMCAYSAIMRRPEIIIQVTEGTQRRTCPGKVDKIVPARHSQRLAQTTKQYEEG